MKNKKEIEKNNTDKKFSKEDIIKNFSIYLNTNGFDFNATIEEKLNTYMDWLDTKIV